MWPATERDPLPQRGYLHLCICYVSIISLPAGPARSVCLGKCLNNRGPADAGRAGAVPPPLVPPPAAPEAPASAVLRGETAAAGAGSSWGARCLSAPLWLCLSAPLSSVGSGSAGSVPRRCAFPRPRWADSDPLAEAGRRCSGLAVSSQLGCPVSDPS